MSAKCDVVVVGGRCAGSVLALRLARAGARVVIVDRDELGSDTLSTHALFPNTVARLDDSACSRRWWLATTCPSCATACASWATRR